MQNIKNKNIRCENYGIIENVNVANIFVQEMLARNNFDYVSTFHKIIFGTKECKHNITLDTPICQSKEIRYKISNNIDIYVPFTTVEHHIQAFWFMDEYHFEM